MDKNDDFLRENIIKIIDSTGLSDQDFGLLCEISRPTIVNLKNGSSKGTILTLYKIADFTQIKLQKLLQPGYTPPKNLRQKLIKSYKNDIQKAVILQKPPTTPYIIKHQLLQTPFLNEFRERYEIVQFIQEKFGYKIEPNTLTKTLKRLESSIESEPIENKKKGYRYKVRKNNDLK